MAHEISVKAPKAGINTDVKFIINDWPEGKDMEYINNAIKLWGASVVADNIESIAEQKAQNAFRAALNPNAKGEPGLSVAKVQSDLAAGWKLGAVRPRGVRPVSSETYMAMLESKTPEDIMAEIEKMKALLQAKKQAVKTPK